MDLFIEAIYAIYRLFLTSHSCSVTIFTFGFRLFFILLKINLTFNILIHDSLVFFQVEEDSHLLPRIQMVTFITLYLAV